MRVLLFVALAVCLLAMVAAEANKPHPHRAITLESTAAKENLKSVTVIQAPNPPHYKHKMKGNFSHRPLLDNGKEFLKAPVARKYRRDPCTGCVVPVKVHPKLDPRNRLDRKGNVIGKKRVLEVEPELRERERHFDIERAQRRQARRAAREAAREARKATREANMRPEFYPLTHEQRKKLRKEKGLKPHKVAKRLPNIPEFYPAKKPKRLFNPPEGWPDEHPCKENC